MRFITNMFKDSKIRIIIFPVIFLILVTIIGVNNRHLFNGSRESVIFTYVDSFLKGDIGSGYGEYSQEVVPWAGLEPGDIILGGWPNTAYGCFSHAGLYIGDNKVLEGYVDNGLTIQELNHYLHYSELCLLKVNASPAVKNKAVAYAVSQENEMFYPVAFKRGERIWNCTTIIWKAYKLQGIDLDEINDLWIAPESFTISRYVSILYEKGI